MNSFPITVSWPGFGADGSLLLPLPDATFASGLPGSLAWQGHTLQRKHEFHVTVLNRACGSAARQALGEEGVRRLFVAGQWALHRTGDARLLHRPGTPPVYSLIEDLALPALNAFRARLARAMGTRLPAVQPHVTLYTAGKSTGIGLPDMATLAGMELTRLRLPGINSRPPPPLPAALAQAYHDTDYTVAAAPGLVLRIGRHNAGCDALLDACNVTRAILLSACNPYSQAYPDSANRLRHALLTGALQGAGFAILAAEGRDPTGSWPPETSVLIMGTTPVQEARLLRDYEQHAAVLVQRGTEPRLLLHPDTTASGQEQ